MRVADGPSAPKRIKHCSRVTCARSHPAHERGETETPFPAENPASGLARPARSRLSGGLTRVYEIVALKRRKTPDAFLQSPPRRLPLSTFRLLPGAERAGSPGYADLDPELAMGGARGRRADLRGGFAAAESGGRQPWLRLRERCRAHAAGASRTPMPPTTPAAGTRSARRRSAGGAGLPAAVTLLMTEMANSANQSLSMYFGLTTAALRRGPIDGPAVDARAHRPQASVRRMGGDHVLDRAALRHGPPPHEDQSRRGNRTAPTA